MSEFNLDPRVASAMEHVQKAGLELIAAMRNALDVAEDLLGDPAAVQVLIAGAAEAAKAATETVSSAATMATQAAAQATQSAGERVERIRVDD